MKTAVQFFWDKIALKLSVEQVNEFLPMLEQAKEMEKEQIIDAWNNGEESEYHYHINAIYRDNAEQYYNQTYGK